MGHLAGALASPRTVSLTFRASGAGVRPERRKGQGEKPAEPSAGCWRQSVDSSARLGCGGEGRQEQEAREASPQIFVDGPCKGGQDLAWAPWDTSARLGSIGSLSTAKVSSPSPFVSWATLAAITHPEALQTANPAL